jgi:hypothetical protein
MVEAHAERRFGLGAAQGSSVALPVMARMMTEILTDDVLPAIMNKLSVEKA